MENEPDLPEQPTHRHAPRRLSTGARFERWWVRHLGGEYVFLVVLASLIGVAGGYGAILFRWAIRLVNRVAFPQGATLSQLALTPWYGIVTPPAFGGLIVGPLVHFLAPEARGPGVAAVMDACRNRGGQIRRRVAVVKTCASAICIGTGGSVGREGPIVQIGSAIGSLAGQLFGLDGNNLRAMVAAGAAAGIAATFNAPIAGILFAMELILRKGSTRTFIPLVVAAVLATVAARVHLGNSPAFVVAPYELVTPWELGIYILLGIASALVGVAFIRGLYAIETLWDRVPVLDWSKAMVGGAFVGVLALRLPQLMGVGYEHIEEMLHWDSVHLPLETWSGAGLLVVLLGAKILATGMSIGSGGSGGIFAPSLFVGACLGGALGHTANVLFPGAVANPGAYALVAMGAMVAATTHAPLTAMLIVFELTNRNSIMLPLMFSCFLASAISMRLSRHSIYTLKLFRQGSWRGAADETEVMTCTHVTALARPVTEILNPDTSLIEVVHQMVDGHHPQMYVVDAESHLLGVVVMDDVAAVTRDEEALQHLLVAADLMRPLPGKAQEGDTLADCLELFSKRAVVKDLPVVDGQGRLTGVLGRADVIAHYNREVLYRDAVVRFVDDQEPSQTAAQVRVSTGEMLEEIVVEGALVGQSLRELDLRARHGVIVFAIVDKNQRTSFPKADMPLQRGQRIEVFGTRQQIGRVRELAAGSKTD